MSIVLDGTTGITTPGLTNTGTETIVNLTTTGNTILGDASTDTLNVGNGGLVKDASGNVGIGTASPAVKLDVSNGYIRINEDGLGTKVIQLRSNWAGVDPAINVQTNNSLLFATNGTERMRIDSSGNVGIGTSSPNSRLTIVAAADLLADFNSTGANGGYMVWRTSGSVIADLGTAKNCFGGAASADTFAINARGARALLLGTNNTERMRIDSSGNLLVGATVGGGFTVFYAATDCINSRSGAAAGNATSLFVGRYSATSSTSGTLCFNVTTNGNVTNANNSYGSLSDVKLKENIVDVSPKLADLMQVRIVNYNFKEGQTHKQIGVVAQELEQVFPSMIEENSDYEEVTTTDEDGNETTERVATGTTTKSVKYSVFVPMLIKALQEQQAIITQLQADVEALKAQP